MPHNFELINSQTLFGSVEAHHWRYPANGLEVMLSPRKGCGVVAVQVWYRVGSAHEDPSVTGLAHFFEHMMFRGTKKYGLGQFDKVLEELGVNGGTNAFTWKDYTAYVEEVPKQAVERVLELEADRMEHLNLIDQSIHEELGAVIDEKQRSLNDPDSVRFDTFFEKAFESQPGAWPVLGYEDHIRAYNKDVLTDYYGKYYKPNNCLVALCGDVSESSLPLVEKYFGHLKRSDAIDDKPRRLQKGSFRFSQPISLTRLEMSFALEVGEEDLWVWDMVGRLIAGNDTCLIEKEFVAKEKVLSANYWICQSKKGEHFFQINLTLLNDQDPEKIRSEIFDYFQQASQWITSELLSIVRVEADAEFYQQMSRLDDRATLLGELWVYDHHFQSLIERQNILNQLTAEVVVRKIESIPQLKKFILVADPE